MTSNAHRRGVFHGPGGISGPSAGVAGAGSRVFHVEHHSAAVRRRRLGGAPEGTGVGPNYWTPLPAVADGRRMNTGALTGSTPPSTAGGIAKKMDLKPEDFIKMMITQLQNQDPMEPAKNEQLLAQMSQIGQLESSTKLQDSLEQMVLQNNLGSAGNLIGKTVVGMGDSGEELAGTVTSVRVEGKSVRLELDNGTSVRMDRVTEINEPGSMVSAF